MLIRIRPLENKCKIWVECLSRCQNLSILFIRILSKCICLFPNFLLSNCGLCILWSFHWYLAIAVCHLESNESGSGAGFMVSWIRILFQTIWPEETQRILKPVSIFGLMKQGLNVRQYQVPNLLIPDMECGGRGRGGVGVGGRWQGGGAGGSENGSGSGTEVGTSGGAGPGWGRGLGAGVGAGECECGCECGCGCGWVWRWRWGWVSE